MANWCRDACSVYWILYLLLPTTLSHFFQTSYFSQKKFYFIKTWALKSRMEPRQEFCYWCEWRVLCTCDPSDDIPLHIPAALSEGLPAGSLCASSLPQNKSGQLPHERDLILTRLRITIQAASLLLYFWNVAQLACKGVPVVTFKQRCDTIA